jgi:hypothetical protein
MSDDFSGDAAAYSNLAREVASSDPTDDLLGHTEPETLDRQQVEHGYRQANQQHQRAAAQGPQQQQRQREQDQLDRDTDPVGYLENRIARVADHSVQQAQHAQQMAVARGVEHSENQARQAFSDYDQAVHHLESQRMGELRQLFPDAALKAQGHSNPQAVRDQMLNRDRMGIVHMAMQRGMSPAALYYQLALNKGYQSQRGVNTHELNFMENASDDDFDKGWEILKRRGQL